MATQPEDRRGEEEGGQPAGGPAQEQDHGSADGQRAGDAGGDGGGESSALHNGGATGGGDGVCCVPGPPAGDWSRPGVYLIRDAASGAYKIGKSVCPTTRVAAISVGLPSDIAKILVVNTERTTELEGALHRRFATQRVRGEWFRLSRDDVNWMAALTRDGVESFLGPVPVPFIPDAPAEKQAARFSQRLRELREYKGLTQAALASRSGLRQASIADYERGRSEPTWSSVLALADALGISPDDFATAERNSAF